MAFQIGLRKQHGAVEMTGRVFNGQGHLLRTGPGLSAGTFKCGFLYGANHPHLRGEATERFISFPRFFLGITKIANTLLLFLPPA